MMHRRWNADRSQSRPIARPCAPPVPFETLEKRIFLNGQSQVFKPAPPPLTAPTSTNIADVKAGPMANAGSKLIGLYRDYRRFKNAGGADKDYDHALFDQVMRQGTKIGVTVRGRGTLQELTDRLRASNAEIIYRSGRWTVIDAYVPIGQLHDLARDAGVATINPMYRGQTQQRGTADNQADFVQKTDRVRGDFGLDGSGIQVGVLSDSVNRYDKGLPGSVATGDVPANVRVISDSPTLNPIGAFLEPTDEGRAMLELIHDIAPGAGLSFATADFGMQAFADYIRQLRAAGADVIVDDIGFFAESWYQPSVIDHAINDVVADGAVYLSSAGNSSPNSAIEGNTNWTKDLRDRFVDFDPGPAVDTRLRIKMDFGGTFFFQWDEPYNGVVGSSQTDIDVFVYDSVYGRKFHVGQDNNIRTGIPLEAFTIPAGEWDIEIHLEDRVDGAPLPTRYRMISFGEAGITEVEYPVLNMASIAGHNGGENTISVGAVPFFQPSENEEFSSTGPVTRMFDAAGNRLSEPVSLQKPDISGIDGVNTSFFPSPFFPGVIPPNPIFESDIPQDDDRHPNFFGTSAAAPNVAALVALMRQVQPDASQEEIVTALRETAIPINGSTGGYDEQGGFGLVDGRAAVDRFVANPTVDIQDVRPDPRTEPVDHIKIVFSQRVEGFDLSDVTLTRDGGPNLLTGAQTLRTTDGGRTWLLRELRTLTDDPGTYLVSVLAANTGIVNLSTLAQPLQDPAFEEWQLIEFPGPPTTPSNLRAKVVGDGVVRLRWDDNSGNEDRFVIQRATDRNFATGLTNFSVPFDTTVFTDSGLVANRRYFYRVRAFNNFSLFEGQSNVVEIFVPGRGDIVMDNRSNGVLIEGDWALSTQTPGFLGEDYLDDRDDGKAQKFVRFTPNIAKADDYYVYARWTRASNHATNVPIDILHNGGTFKRTVLVDQRNTGGDGWVLLGKFRMTVGRDNFVRIRTDATDGLVTIDAVRFQPVTGTT